MVVLDSLIVLLVLALDMLVAVEVVEDFLEDLVEQEVLVVVMVTLEMDLLEYLLDHQHLLVVQTLAVVEEEGDTLSLKMLIGLVDPEVLV
jgi:hypothetical protein